MDIERYKKNYYQIYDFFFENTRKKFVPIGERSYFLECISPNGTAYSYCYSNNDNEFSEQEIFEILFDRYVTDAHNQCKHCKKTYNEKCKGCFLKGGKK